MVAATIIAPLLAAGPAAARPAFDLPSVKRCVSAGTLSVRMQQPVRGEWTRLTVTVDGERVERVTRPRPGRRIRVRPLPPAGAATVELVARRSDGHTVTATRRYHACVPGGKPEVTVPEGAPPTTLATRDLVVGTGARARPGQDVTVRYVLVTWSDRAPVDAAWRPFRFPVGRDVVIPGFDQGVEGMRVGGRRELIIPPGLGYGDEGAPPAIAPGETLVFQVDLIEIHPRRR